MYLIEYTRNNIKLYQNIKRLLYPVWPEGILFFYLILSPILYRHCNKIYNRSIHFIELWEFLC